MRKRFLIALALILPLPAADRSKQVVSATHTDHFTGSPNGTIRLENSFGEADIQGWDQPVVEVTVNRSSEHYYDAQDRAAAQRRLDRVKVEVKQQAGEVVISTVYPPRSWFLYPLSRRSDIEIVYEIHAPRSWNLLIHHNSGGINVSGIRGAIHATVINGQITLALAPGPHTIDARCGLGKVYSDFDGRERSRPRIGGQFTAAAGSKGTNLYLRVRIGDIVLLEQSGTSD